MGLVEVRRRADSGGRRLHRDGTAALSAGLDLKGNLEGPPATPFQMIGLRPR
jgi:hypothetical protein